MTRHPIMLRWVVTALVIGGALTMFWFPILLHAAWPSAPEWMSTLLVKAGEAGLVAAALAVTVDQYIKSRLVREIVTDLSPHMMSSFLPEKLRDEIHFLCGLRLFRRDLELEYEIQPYPPDRVLLVTTVRFRMENTTDYAQKFVHSMAVEKCNSEAIDQILRMGATGVVGQDGGKADYNLYGKDLKQAVSTDKTGFEITCKREVWIPPTRGGEAAEFWSETRQIFGASSSDTFFSSHSTLGKKVSVRKPSDMSVRVDIPHRMEQTQHRPPDDPCVWVHTGAFLPFSALTIEWKKDPPVDSTAANTGVQPCDPGSITVA